MRSPKNFRSEVDDVVMILTDGEPIRRRGESSFGEKYRSWRNGERLQANDRANSLKSKDVTVVGLAIGYESRSKRLRHLIKTWSTKGKDFETSMNNL